MSKPLSPAEIARRDELVDWLARWLNAVAKAKAAENLALPLHRLMSPEEIELLGNGSLPEKIARAERRLELTGLCAREGRNMGEPVAARADELRAAELAEASEILGRLYAAPKTVQ